MSDNEKLTATGAAPGAGESVAVAQIETELDQTRAAITGDLRTLGERLSPERIKEEAREVMTEAKNTAVETLHEAKNVATNTFREIKQDALETVSGKVDEFRGNVRDVERQAVGFVRENAVPLALIGIGVAWFVANRRTREARWEGGYVSRGAPNWRDGDRSSLIDDARDRAYRAREGVSRVAGGAKHGAREWVDEIGNKADQVAGKARDFADRQVQDVRGLTRDARETLGRATHEARSLASRELRHARDFSRNATEEHPLAIGAAAVAAGVCIGLVLPETRRESEWFGAERSRLVDGAKEVIQDLGHTAKEAAQEVKSGIGAALSP